MESSDSAIVTQPLGVTVDQLVIKPMEQADSEFAATMLIEAFLPKMEHAVGKNKIDALTSGMAREMRTRPPGGYTDILIAWYAGERAGFIKLGFHDTKRTEGVQSYPGIGLCCGGIRMALIDAATTQKVGKGTCYLDTIAVDAKFRGKGVGSGLLQAADQEAIRRGCNKIFLHVVEENPAIRLYERQGYKIEATSESCCFNFAAGYSTYHRMTKQLM